MMICLLINLLVLVFLPINGLRQETCGRYGCSRGDYESKLISSFREGCPSEMNNVQCALRKVEDIKDWLSRNNKFEILIAGKMGTGKSTLVKGLTENYDRDVDHLLPHTVNVTSYSYQQDSVDLTIFDTPGLEDNINGTNDYSYLKEMIRNSYEPNLLIFAVRMDEEFRNDDLAAIKNISAAFGWRVWKKAMIILTFANRVRHPDVQVDYDTKENKKFFNKIHDDHELNITRVLRDCQVQEEVVNSIPVVPVGLVQQPFIPSDERGVSWVKEFWDVVHARLKVPQQGKAPNAGSEAPRQATSSPSATCIPFTPEMCTPEICKCPPCEKAKSMWESVFN